MLPFAQRWKPGSSTTRKRISPMFTAASAVAITPRFSEGTDIGIPPRKLPGEILDVRGDGGPVVGAARALQALAHGGEAHRADRLARALDALRRMVHLAQVLVLDRVPQQARILGVVDADALQDVARP